MGNLARSRFRIVLFGVGVSCGYGLVAYGVGTVYPDTQPITTVVAIGLAVITVYVDLILQEIRNNRLPSAVRRIGRLLTRIEDPWLRKVAEDLVIRIGKILDGLAKPIETFESEPALYRALTEQVNSMTMGDKLFAVCADKTWDSVPVRAYLDANIQASEKRGVLIHRVFYEFKSNAREEAQRQADHGIAASVLGRDKIDVLSEVNQIPPDLGIAVFPHGVVFVHRGVGRKTRAYKYECQHLATMIESLFEAVEAMAVRVQPKVGRGPAVEKKNELLRSPRP